MPIAKLGKKPAFNGRWWRHMMKLPQANFFLEFVLVTMKNECQNLFLPQHALIISFFINGKMSFSFCCVQEICTTQTHLQSKMSHNQIKGAIRLVDNWLAEQENSKMIVSCHIDCTKANHIIEIWIWEKFIFRPLIHCRVSGEVKVIEEVDAVGKKFQILHFFAFEC